MDPRLSDTFPALELYYAVNKNYYDHSASKPGVTATPSSSTASDCDSPSPLGSPHTIFGPGIFSICILIIEFDRNTFTIF